MARPQKVVKSVYKNLSLQEDLVLRMELELYSEAEGRVPYGAQAEFINGLMREHFKAIDEKRNAQ